MSAVSVVNEREIQPMQLSLEQLSQLKTQHEDELQELQRQLDSLSTARARFLNARNTLSDMKVADDGNVILVPLNSSLYVPGKISDPTKAIPKLCSCSRPKYDHLFIRSFSLCRLLLSLALVTFAKSRFLLHRS